MKSVWLAVAFLAVAFLSGCAQNLHKPTTTGNAGTFALVAYAAAGAGVGQYLALPLCAAPPVYPCKTQALNDRLVAADTVAYNAAVAADNAVNDATKQTAAANANQALKAAATAANAAKNGGGQ